MNKISYFTANSILLMSLLLFSCTGNGTQQTSGDTLCTEDFYNVEKFADLGILRYKVTGWEELTPDQQKLVYCLNEAALQGRDILFDQNNRYNLAIRRTLEAIYEDFQGDRESNDFKELEIYLKRVWFSNGIHHHYGEEKFLPGFSKLFFAEALKSLDPARVPVRNGQSADEFLAEITPVIFDPAVYAKKVNQESSLDVIVHSANNYYEEGISQNEVESFYAAMADPADPTPVAYGLNSRLVKRDNILTEEVCKVGGRYSQAIEKIVYWLEEALNYTENDQQKKYIGLLIDYYKSGDLKTYDRYAIEWVQDTASTVDFVNGFTETYGDALGIKASWEALVNFKDIQATKLSDKLCAHAQWFEDHAPIDSRFKKSEVKGVTSKVINASILGGDCYPATPIGINLPNSNWIRKAYGSKSVTIANITDAYDKAAAGSGLNEEFVCGAYEKELLEKFASQTNNLHTELHECLGHGSGQLLPGVSENALGIYGATIEEARADLFGLYYIPDAKMVELGMLNDSEAYKAEYYRFMMNGLITQLSRIEPGKNIEESHMRNRALIANWVLEKGKEEGVAELKKEKGKTYIFINDYEKMRILIGELLAEIQRIKSEGDLVSAREMVEQYAVKVDPELHKEVLERYGKLNIAPYKGFVNPVYKAERDAGGTITEIALSYSEGYAEQMMRYSRDYSHLPTYND